MLNYTEEFTVYDEYVSALLLEMEELAQLEPHPNVVGLIRVCTVGSEYYHSSLHHYYNLLLRATLYGNGIYVSWRSFGVPSVNKRT